MHQGATKQMTVKPKTTAAEQDLLHALNSGASNKQVAAATRNSEQTVRNQLSTLYRKINVSNRTQAVSWYRENGPFAAAKANE
jgi:LuxR family transcriptional regulator, maltose regulon positive regulatory protein